MNSFITEFLFSNADASYRDFNSKLIPTVSKERIIGVRTPVLRKYAIEISGTAPADEFLASLPHKYYEENNLHGFIIEKIKIFDDCLREINCFLPHIDNWATCDGISPPVFKQHPEKILAAAEKWINSAHIYTVRYGIGVYMKYFLDKNFSPERLTEIARIKSDEYYINTMISWYFATALAKQYDYAVPYIENRLLSRQVHSKTIQKAIESYRITPDKKAYLKSLK